MIFWKFQNEEEVLTEAAKGGALLKKGVLKKFPKFTGKHLCQSLFFYKVAGCDFIRKILWLRCFPVNFTKFLRTPFLQNTRGRLLQLLKRDSLI